MKLTTNMPCWEIVRCIGAEDCPARTCPEIPCWEIADLLDAGAALWNVCEECIVYLVKTNDPLLPPDELEEILKMRNILWYIDRCPAFDRRPWQGEIFRRDGKGKNPDHGHRPDGDGCFPPCPAEPCGE